MVHFAHHTSRTASALSSEGESKRRLGGTTQANKDPIFFPDMPKVFTPGFRARCGNREMALGVPTSSITHDEDDMVDFEGFRPAIDDGSRIGVCTELNPG